MQLIFLINSSHKFFLILGFDNFWWSRFRICRRGPVFPFKLLITRNFRNIAQWLQSNNCDLIVASIQRRSISLLSTEAVVWRCSVKPATLFKKRLWHRCFPANFTKFLRTPFLRTPLVAASVVTKWSMSFYYEDGSMWHIEFSWKNLWQQLDC